MPAYMSGTEVTSINSINTNFLACILRFWKEAVGKPKSLITVSDQENKLGCYSH